MDFQHGRREALSSIKQATLPALVLPIGHRLRKMKWAVTRSTDSVHIGVLTLSSNNRCGSPMVILGIHPKRVGQDLVGENPVMAQTFLNQFIKV